MKSRNWQKVLIWRAKHVSNRQLMMLLGIFTGIIAGLVAVIIKYAAKGIGGWVEKLITNNSDGALYLIFPSIGILISILFIRYILRRPVRHGVSNVLFSISKNEGKINQHNMFSSVVTSSLTVGFGGSVGLEGPSVMTSSAIGSNIGQLFKVNYKQAILLIGCGAAASMAALFNAPIAAIVFALEVIMLDLTLNSLVPILFASVSSVLVSYAFLGNEVVYPFKVIVAFEMSDIPFYIGLGVFCGFLAVYFTRIFLLLESLFNRIRNIWIKWFVGSFTLGMLIFMFPSLFGEGYHAINNCLANDTHHLFENSPFANWSSSVWGLILLLTMMVVFKVIAASVTMGAGGIGGIFAPTLFMGAHAGLLYANIVNAIGVHTIYNRNFALMGMAGLIAGVMHAPLTAIFLIAELSFGYELFVPLMITATISYAITRIFEKHSVYTSQLAKRNELVTHNKDQAALTVMNVRSLIETDFVKIYPNAFLGDLVQIISRAHRNIFPVVDSKGYLVGMIKLDDIREIMFKPEYYDITIVKELMYMPEFFVSPDDTMEDLVAMFSKSNRYNIAVVDRGKYLGFISRARTFTAYRDYIKRLSEDE